MQRIIRIRKKIYSFRKEIIRYRIAFILIAAGVFFIPFISPTEGTAPGMVTFFGRFHPLVVHFPIVLVLLAFIFELLRLLKIGRISASISGLVLGLAIGSTLFSLGLGFLLYYTGEYTGETVQQHLWGGVLLTAFLSVAMYFFLSHQLSYSPPALKGYIFCLIAANIILIYTSHHGGSLTHGNSYLTEYFPDFSNNESKWKPKPIEEMLVYEDVILPFLDRKCMSCHNENKAKGGLAMTSYERLLKGGKSGHPALVPGSLAESDIYRRITLPLSDEEAMPPEGKTPLTDDEVKLLSWWINHDARLELKVTEASGDPGVQPVLQVYLAELETQQRNRFLQKLSTKKLIKTVANKDNYVLQIDPYDDKGIMLSMPFPPAKFDDNDLANLQPIFPSITKASLIGSDISDDGFYYLGQMQALKELYLQQTQIKGSGLIHLSRLSNLKLLDLSKTEVTNGQILHILYLTSLEDIYLNETNISEEIIEAIRENKPALNVHLVRGGMF